MKLLLSIDVLFLLLGMTSFVDGRRSIDKKKEGLLNRAGPLTNEAAGKADDTSKSKSEHPSEMPSAIPGLRLSKFDPLKKSPRKFPIITSSRSKESAW